MSECDYHSWKSIKPGAHCPYCAVNKLRDDRDININIIKDLKKEAEALAEALEKQLEYQHNGDSMLLEALTRWKKFKEKK